AIYSLALHDALPIYGMRSALRLGQFRHKVSQAQWRIRLFGVSTCLDMQGQRPWIGKFEQTEFAFDIRQYPIASQIQILEDQLAFALGQGKRRLQVTHVEQQGLAVQLEVKRA